MTLSRRAVLVGLAGLGVACTTQRTASVAPAPTVPATRSFQHALGTVTIPGDPKRIVALENTPLEALLAVGVTPVAVAAGATGLVPQLAAKAGNAVSVGSTVEPDLELVAAQQPDLILAVKARHEAIAARLASIAPTVYSDAGASQWKENLRLFADAAGKASAADRAIADYDAQAKRLRDRLGATPPSVSLVWFGGGAARVYLKGAFSGSILDDIGARRPAIAQRDGVWLALSPELLPEVDADRLLVMRSADAQAIEDRTRSSAVWQSLAAVRRDAVTDVSADSWFSGGGLVSALLILADLERILG